MNVELCPYCFTGKNIFLFPLFYILAVLSGWYGFESLVSWCLCFPSWCVANPAVLSVAVPVALPPAHQML